MSCINTYQNNTNHNKNINDAYFLSKSYQIHATDCLCSINTPASNLDSLVNQINDIFHELKEKEHENPILLGAIPFDTDQSSALNFYANPSKNYVEHLTGKLYLDNKITNIKELINENQFKSTVNLALKSIQDNELQKIVLSRLLEIDLNQSPKITDVVNTLYQQDPNAYTFAVPVSDDETIIGVSPELLLYKNENQIKSNPLAGSRKLSFDKSIDIDNELELQSSLKDQFEHRLVVDSISSHLAPFCKKLFITDEPEILYTSTMMHLSSKLNGTLRADAPDALSLALALHPTPAVCGVPTTPAKEFIQTQEGYDRRFYSGLVGWMDSEGNGEWVVTIRCGLLNKNNLKLYAGAGLVDGSSPELEWMETSNKLQTMLNIFATDE